MPFSNEKSPLLAEGDCILIDAVHNSCRNLHLYFIVLMINDNQQSCLIIPLCSARQRGYDNTVTLYKGDHPFIIRNSFVRFRDAKKVTYSKLIKIINNSRAQKQVPISSDLLKRIQGGIMTSQFTPNKIKQVYQDWCFDQL